MPVRPEDLVTGGALQGAVAESLVRQRDEAAMLPPGTEVGAFRVVRELGRGGMAVVYLAERADGEYDQQVALKWMLQAQPDAASAQLFRRERQALADLRHPHIARLLDGGRTAEGRPWFAMEFIDGQPIDAHCAALPAPARLRLFLQVCEAVAFAHARGVLHRDIKPSNVLVDADGSARLLDFGIAHLLGQEDAPAVRAYTPGFASPEQLRGETLTVGSDIYQLGRLLQAMLPMPTALTPRERDDLGAIVAKATADDPAQRYGTVAALAADIDASLQTRPLDAHPRSAGYLARRFVARHRVGTALGTLALLALVATVAVFTWRLRVQRDAAEYQARVATSVLAFLREDLLSAADPAAAPGRELSVRDALDLASAAADTRFAGAPVEHAAIRITLADLYLQLGRYEESEREARRALALSASPAQRLGAQGMLADVLLDRDRLDDAEALQRELLPALIATYGADARETWLARNRTARLHNRRGRFDDAERAHAEVAAQATRLFGAGDVLATSAASERALNLQMLGRQDEALPILRDGLETLRRSLGADHPATLEAAHELGVLLRHRGEGEAALAVLQPTLDARRRVLGATHPDTLASSNELATALQELKRYEDAEPLFRATLDARLATLGEAHQYTRNSMSNLGLLYSVWGKLDQAAPLYEHALEVELRLIGDGHPDTLALMHNIAGLYRKQGRFEDALAMHRRVLDGARRSGELGAEAWQTGLFRAGMALTLQAAKDYPQAESELLGAIATLEGSLGPDHARSVRAREMLEALRAESRGATPAPAAPR